MSGRAEPILGCIFGLESSIVELGREVYGAVVFRVCGPNLLCNQFLPYIIQLYNT
ncbi:hypothetical protein HanIR_Chr17g0886961 [Helianthus annuus]|nr:hypothetical protein HanIR_Chr17g0886961 [Helianthus annuus]